MKERSPQEVLAKKLLKKITNKEPETEYRFHESRKWRFDFAYPKPKIAIEIEGGLWIGGRHIHPAGFEKDCEKYNEATAMGWKVFRVPPKFINEEYLTHLLFFAEQ